MITMYVLLDGFDLGTGVIHLLAARTPDERRTMLRAIGPVWDGNEVWFIAAGGTLFFTFPVLYASSFSGFYLPLIMALWLLMLRGVAIELRGQVNNPVWATFWDGVFAFGSTLLVIFFGAALANVVRGVPLDAHGAFFEPLWTDLNPRSSDPGILDWYTVLVALLALAVLTVHGANWIVVKTEGAVNARARRLAWRAWLATVVLTILATVATFWLRSGLLARFNAAPWGYVFPLLAVGGLAALGYALSRGYERPAFLASSAYIVGMLGGTAFGLYPNVLPAVNPAHSLTVGNASASHYGQTVGLVWWIIGMILAVIYFTVTYRLFRGKVRLASGEGY
jgi:cytochrome d ubiquinol oxidase subunit II